MKLLFAFLMLAISQSLIAKDVSPEKSARPIPVAIAAILADTILDCPEDALPLCLSQDTVRINEQVCVSASAVNYSAITGFQFALAYDSAALSFTGLSFGADLTDLDSTDINTGFASGGVITVAYYQGNGEGETLADGTELFSICFTGLEAGCNVLTVSDTLVGETLVSFDDGSTSPYRGNAGSITVLDCRDTTVTIFATICAGNVFPFRDLAIANPGTYSFTDVTSEGCDSTTVLELTGNQVDFSLPEQIGFCAGETVRIDAPDSVRLGLVTTPLDQLQPSIILSPGMNEVQLLEVVSGCVKIQTVNVFPFEAPAVTITGVAEICAGDEGTELTATGAVTYLWSTGDTTQSIIAPAGPVSVTGTDENGCTAMASFTVTESPLPNAQIFGDLVYCPQDGGTVLTGRGGGTYEWSTEDTTQSITVIAGEYVLTVTNAAGCQDTASVRVSAEAVPPVFATCPQNTERAINTGQSGIIVNWNEPLVEDNCGPVGLAVESSLPSGSLFGLGETTVLYTATDSAGNTATCEFVVTVTESDELTFYVDSAAVTVDGDLFCIPIKVENYNEVSAFSVAFQLPAFAGTEFIGTELGAELEALASEGAFSGRNEADGRTSVLLVNETGLGFTLDDGSVAFTFKIRIPGLGGDCFDVAPIFDYITIGAFREGPGRVVPTLRGGKACYPAEVDITGRIYKCYDERLTVGAADVLIEDSEGDDDFDITDAAGRYAFLEQPYGLDFTITPERDFDDAEGLDIFDLLGLVRHIRGIQFITDPCMQIAADVNRSGSINLGDIPDIQELIVGNLNEFPSNTSWRFVPTSFVFDGPALITPFPEMAEILDLRRDTVVDFYGIKIGDLDQSAIGQVTTGGNGTASFRLNDAPIAEGQRVRVPVSYDEAQKKLAGFQQGWRFSTDHLRYVATEPVKRTAAGLVVNHDLATKGDILLNWIDTSIDTPEKGAVITEQEVLYYLEFEALRSGVLSDFLEPASPLLANLAAHNQGNAAAAIHTSFVPLPARDTRLRVLPNPVLSNGTLRLTLSESTAWTLSITDMLGRQTSELSGTAVAGEHLLPLPDSALPVNGTYVVVLTTERGERIVQKIIKQ